MHNLVFLFFNFYGGEVNFADGFQDYQGDTDTEKLKI